MIGDNIFFLSEVTSSLEPFKIKDKKYLIPKITREGDKILLKESDIKKAASVGFKCPTIKGVSLDTNNPIDIIYEHKLILL